MRFFLPMIPPTITAQQKGVNFAKRRVYTKAEVLAVHQKLASHLAPHRPETPMTGPVRLTTKWLFPLSGKHKNGEYMSSKPDTDNLIKLLKDVMSTLQFWRDDAQVASEITEKFYAITPGIYVSVEALNDVL